jgi:AcrR family transcriptional regulator
MGFVESKRRVRRTRAEQREETRRRLLEAAGGLFLHRGYEATSIEDVAEAAGFTRGAVYSNFRDKEDLFVAFLAERMAEEAAEVAAAVAAEPDRAARMRILRERFVTSHCKDTTLLYAELQLAAARQPALRRKLRVLYEKHVETFARIVADVHGEIPAQFRPVFVAMFATMVGIGLQDAGGHVDAAAAEAALALIFDALAPLVTSPPS